MPTVKQCMSLFMVAVMMVSCSKRNLQEKADVSNKTALLNGGVQALDAVPGAKKGACFSTTTQIGTWYGNVDSVKANWFYTWGNNINFTQAPAVEFVPMFWGKSSVNSTNIANIISLKNQGKVSYVLGFNEPDLSSQSNMPVDTALAYWPQLESIGLPLGSPATSWPTRQWLYDFMDSAIARGRRVDFICVHMYVGTDDVNFVQVLQNLYNKYHLPIWITEFATCYDPAVTMNDNPFTPDKVLSFMQRLLPKLEDLSFVQRYSWFSGSPTSPRLWSSALIDANGKLTTLGSWYAGFTSKQGSGTSLDPYMIYSASAFDNIRNNPTKNFEVYGELNLSGNWTPIPSFSGTLDGKGYKVNGLTMNNTAANGGLISTNSGTVKNLQLLNVNCTTSNSFGTVAGTNSGGTIQNVVVSGTVTATQTGDVPVGGIAGDMTGTAYIKQCYAKLNMTVASSMAGGIAGRINGGTGEISDCGSAGTLTISAASSTPTKIGGILGRIVNTSGTTGTIKNCASAMSLKATGTNATSVNSVGGIFGADQGTGITIDQCLFNGNIEVGHTLGGIAGVGSNITNCIAIGTGAGASNAMLKSTGTPNPGSLGGIAGTLKVKLENCIVKNATLKVTTLPASSPANYAPGGIASTYQNNGYTKNSVVLVTSVEGAAGANSSYVYRVSGTAANGIGVNSGNYVGPSVTTPGRTTSYTDSTGSLDGKYQSSVPFSFFTGIGFSATIWKTDTDGYPTLTKAGYNGGYTIP